MGNGRRCKLKFTFILSEGGECTLEFKSIQDFKMFLEAFYEVKVYTGVIEAINDNLGELVSLYVNNARIY